jgi:hypothetical protein
MPIYDVRKNCRKCLKIYILKMALLVPHEVFVIDIRRYAFWLILCDTEDFTCRAFV